MEKKTLIIIGLIGGVIAVAGVFLDWVTASAEGASTGASGWATTSELASPYLVLGGGILALLGGIEVLEGTKVKGIGYLLPIGGILAIAGAVWGLADIPTGTHTVMGISVTYSWGYGLYLCVVGGILALVGSLGLKGK